VKAPDQQKLPSRCTAPQGPEEASRTTGPGMRALKAAFNQGAAPTGEAPPQRAGRALVPGAGTC